MTSLLKNIITFGAQGRIDKALKSLQGVSRMRDFKYCELVEKRKVLSIKSESLLSLKKRSLSELKKINTINKSLSVKDREIVSLHIKESLDSKSISLELLSEVESFTTSDYLNGASKGAIAAATSSTALLFGDAAAISTGVAASAIAIPAIIAIGAFAHISASKKINAIQDAERVALRDVANINEKMLEYEATSKRCDEINLLLIRSISVYRKMYKSTYRAVYPIPLFSRIFRSKDKRLSEGELKKLYDLASSVQAILLIIESGK